MKSASKGRPAGRPYSDVGADGRPVGTNLFVPELWGMAADRKVGGRYEFVIPTSPQSGGDCVTSANQIRNAEYGCRADYFRALFFLSPSVSEGNSPKRSR